MNEQILIVDDEKNITELIRCNLERHGYRATVAENGEQAISAVQCGEPDLVLLDVMLPELSGWEVCAQLRASTKGKSLPVIMLSALGSEGDRIRGLDLGADDYLAKPFSMKELLLKIRRLLDRAQAAAAARARQDEQDAVFRHVVHELNNSLSVIGGFSHLALTRNTPAYLGYISSSASYMEGVLRDASFLARLGQSGGTLPLEAVELAPLLDDAVVSFSERAEKKGVVLSLSDSPSSFVMGNVSGVRRILENLLSNAVNYNRQGGRVWVRCDEREHWLDLSVKDEGPGIPKDELPRVFDKFFRGRESSGVKGAGLGLHVARLLAEAMGGAVACASAEGGGSTFTLSLRKATAAAARALNGAPAAKEGPWTERRTDAGTSAATKQRNASSPTHGTLTASRTS